MRSEVIGRIVPNETLCAKETSLVPVAQRTEHGAPTAGVAGSIPAGDAEDWRQVHWAPRYWVSNHGRVCNATTDKVLTCARNNKGYYQAFLRVDGRTQRPLLSRLVAEAFLGPCPDGLTVDHKDRNTANNHVSNLEYVTQAENTRRWVSMDRAAGLIGPKRKRGGK